MRKRRSVGGCDRGVSLVSSYASFTSSSSSSSLSSWTTLLLLVLLLSTGTVHSNESDASEKQAQWEILTKRNFSSQIRLHPHLLLMVTVPWCGESRSLMKELSLMVSDKQEKVGSLKLVLLYRSTDRMLADALGASEGTNILFYSQSAPYKYQGRLRAQNILSSARFLMSNSLEEFSLKSLNTPEDLKAFLESTDKSLLLLEFCGWTRRLLAKGKNNGTENVFEGQFGAGLDVETNRTRASKRKNDQNMGIETEKMKCGIDNGLYGIPWLQEYSSVTDSTLLEAENMNPSGRSSCSIEDFQRFESFFWKFMTLVREFLLPPERLRIGVVPERYLLSSLGIGDSGSWLMMLYFAGCPGCSKVVREGDDLRSVLQMHNSLVEEIDGDGHEFEPSLSANKPSILLFIDRSSDSLETRQKSKEALKSFRDLAMHYQIEGQTYAKPVKSFVEASRPSRSTAGYRSAKPRKFQKIAHGNEMSVVIVNEGNHVGLDKIASDIQGTSLHEILAYALQHKKEVKLSSLAKEVGFQLISDDFNVKIAEALQKQTDAVHSDQVSSELPMEDGLKSNIGLNVEEALHVPGTFGQEYEKQSRGTDSETLGYHGEKATNSDTRGQSSLEVVQHNSNSILASMKDVENEKKTDTGLEKSEELKFQSNMFDGSFSFSDGGYRLLEALTAGHKIPSVVLVDPISQQHYVFPEETIISYSSLSEFVHRFLNGSLLPYQRSESHVMSTRDAPGPPLVNLDFHEANSVPHVTSHSFSEMVLGINQSDATEVGYAWKKDVLVLFSNNWCGFCQRMELVVREVYRALKGYRSTLKNGSRSKNDLFRGDDLEENTSILPLVYFMDCLLNDCSSILRSTVQRELYPSLLLFPAENKNAVIYDGDMTVSDIINFIVDHGSNSHILVGEKGVVWGGPERRNLNQKEYNDTLQTAVQSEAPLPKDQYHVILVQNTAPRLAPHYNHIIPGAQNSPEERSLEVVVGFILHSTEKLLNADLFDKSTILIVSVDRGTGFQGLIVNKHISWDSVGDLDEGYEQLKEAPLSLGGPLVKHGMPLVALTRRKFITDTQPSEVLPNVHFLDQSATIREMEEIKLGNQFVTDYWFFLGYSSWGWDQLFDEISGGAWTISDGNEGELHWPWT